MVLWLERTTFVAFFSALAHNTPSVKEKVDMLASEISEEEDTENVISPMNKDTKKRASNKLSSSTKPCDNVVRKTIKTLLPDASKVKGKKIATDSFRKLDVDVRCGSVSSMRGKRSCPSTSASKSCGGVNEVDDSDDDYSDDEEDFSEVEEDVNDDGSSDSEDEEEDENEVDFDDMYDNEREDGNMCVVVRKEEALSDAKKKFSKKARLETVTGLCDNCTPKQLDSRVNSEDPLVKTLFLLSDTLTTMKGVFPESLCVEFRMEEERLKKEIMDASNPSHEVMFSAFSNILRAMSPHVVNTMGMNATTMAMTNLHSDGLCAASEVVQEVVSYLNKLNKRVLVLKDKVLESSESMQKYYAKILR